MRKNIVRAKCISGIYKDKDLEIQIGQTGADCKILIGNKDISSKVFSAHIHLEAGEITKVNLMLVKEEI